MSFVDQLASGPSSVEIGRTPTVASRKCVATVRKKSIPSSFSSSSTVDFRGLEGSDTKAENWSATESRQIVEDHRELNHLVSENKGPLDVPIVYVLTRSDHSGPIDCEERCPGHSLRSPLALCSIQRHLSTVEVRQQPPPVAPSAPSAELSRVPPPRPRTTTPLR